MFAAPDCINIESDKILSLAGHDKYNCCFVSLFFSFLRSIIYNFLTLLLAVKMQSL